MLNMAEMRQVFKHGDLGYYYSLELREFRMRHIKIKLFL